MINIAQLNKKMLQDYIHSAAFNSAKNIAISTIRANSHCNNPAATDEDSLLFIATENGEMVGYLGVLPAVFYTANKEEIKGGWLSCIWIAENIRGKGLAKALITEAYERYGGNIILTEFTSDAKKLYEKTNFFTSDCTLNGLRCFAKFNTAEIFPRKIKSLKKFRPILLAMDKLANKIFTLKTIETKWIKTNTINEYSKIINNYQTDFFEKTDKEKIAWIVNFPWLYSGAANHESSRYFFSSAVDFFANEIYTLEDKALAVFSIRNNVLKMPILIGEYQPEEVVSLLLFLCKKHAIVSVDIYNQKIVDFLQKNKSSFTYLHPIHREFLIAKTFKEKLNNQNHQYQDGIGDCAFT